MMDTFVVDKPFYDEEEFKEFWDNHDLDPVSLDILYMYMNMIILLSRKTCFAC